MQAVSIFPQNPPLQKKQFPSIEIAIFFRFLHIEMQMNLIANFIVRLTFLVGFS